MLFDHLRQQSSLFVPHITRGRTDQTTHGVFFHILAHVQPFEMDAQCLGQGTGQSGLAHPRGADKKKTADGCIGTVEPGIGAFDRLGQSLNRLLLSDDPLL